MENHSKKHAGSFVRHGLTTGGGFLAGLSFGSQGFPSGHADLDTAMGSIIVVIGLILSLIKNLKQDA